MHNIYIYIIYIQKMSAVLTWPKTNLAILLAIRWTTSPNTATMLADWWFQPLNMSQLGWLFPIYGKKNVPNHQPDSQTMSETYGLNIIEPLSSSSLRTVRPFPFGRTHVALTTFAKEDRSHGLRSRCRIWISSEHGICLWKAYVISYWNS